MNGHFAKDVPPLQFLSILCSFRGRGNAKIIGWHTPTLGLVLSFGKSWAGIIAVNFRLDLNRANGIHSERSSFGSIIIMLAVSEVPMSWGVKGLRGFTGWRSHGPRGVMGH